MNVLVPMPVLPGAEIMVLDVPSPAKLDLDVPFDVMTVGPFVTV